MKSVVIEKTVKGLDVLVVNVKTGRPINENSVRQIRLKDLESKRELGLIKRGRPVKVKEEIVIEFEIK
jgi:hypothetical protein